MAESVKSSNWHSSQGSNKKHGAGLMLPSIVLRRRFMSILLLLLSIVTLAASEPRMSLSTTSKDTIAATSRTAHLLRGEGGSLTKSNSESLSSLPISSLTTRFRMLQSEGDQNAPKPDQTDPTPAPQAATGAPVNTDQKEVPAGPAPTAAPVESNKPISCDTAKSCEECEQNSVKIKESPLVSYCQWNGTKCETQHYNKPDPEKPFINNCPSVSKTSLVGRAQGFALLLAIFGILLIARQRIVHGSSGFHTSLDRAIDQVTSTVASGGTSRSSRTRYQEVPVDDDDEWGWEDSKPRPAVGDVELSSWRTSSAGSTMTQVNSNNHNKEDDDIQRNVSRSLADSMAKKNKLSPQPIKKRMSSGDQPNNSNSLSLSSSAAVNPPPLAISSLGKPKPSMPKKMEPTPPQQRNDDIFASMGLAARPTFTGAAATGGGAPVVPSTEFRRRASPPSSGGGTTGWARNAAGATTAAATALSASSMNTAANATSMDEEAWDDDADLDDLLND